MEIDLTNAHPCPDCRQCLTNASKCSYCAERDALRAEVERLRGELAAAKAMQITLSGTNNGLLAVAEDWKARAEAAEAHVADLRAALQPIADRVALYPKSMWDNMLSDPAAGCRYSVGIKSVTHVPAGVLMAACAAIARTPAQSLAAVKAAQTKLCAAVVADIATATRDVSEPEWTMALDSIVETLRDMADRIEQEAECQKGKET